MRAVNGWNGRESKAKRGRGEEEGGTLGRWSVAVQRLPRTCILVSQQKLV